jgi:hypothetical protein
MLTFFHIYSIIEGPTPTVGTVSWGASQKMATDYKNVYEKMKAVDVEAVPMYNLESLHLYLKHEQWPNSADLSTFAPAIQLVHVWITHVVDFATILAAAGGAPPRMSKKSGLFESVTLCRDGCEDGYGT